MAIEITTQHASAPIPLPRNINAGLQLSVPTDITLSQGNAAIRGYEKHGADLVLQLADGQALTAENFFVIGENGDFSRLIAQNGEIVATGLLVPEPEQGFETPTDLETSEGFAAPSSEGTVDTAARPNSDPAPVEASAASGSGWARPAMLAGVGLTSGAALLGQGSANENTTSAAASDESATTEASPHSDTSLNEDAPQDTDLDPVSALLGDEDSPYDIGALQADDGTEPASSDDTRDQTSVEMHPETPLEDAAASGSSAPSDVQTDAPSADHPLPEDSIETLLTLGPEAGPPPSSSDTASATDLSDADLPQHDLFDTHTPDNADGILLGGLFSDAAEPYSPIATLTDLLSGLIPEADL